MNEMLDRVRLIVASTSDCEAKATAAITAMREPTDAMIIAMHRALWNGHYRPDAAWRAAIDEALR